MADGQAEPGQILVELRGKGTHLFAELDRAVRAVEKTTSLMGHQTRLMVKGFDGVNKSILSVVQALDKLKSAGSGAASGVVSSTKTAQSGLTGYIASLERAVRSLQSSRAAHLSVADATANATAAKKTANQADERTIANLLREEAGLKRVITAQHELRVLQETNLARRQQAGASAYARQAAIQEKELIGTGVDPGIAKSLAYERSQRVRLDDERKLFERQQRDTEKRDAQYDILKRRTEAYREVKAAGGTYADLQEKLNAIELQAKGHTAARAREQAAMNRELKEGTRAMQGLNKEGNAWLKWSTSPLRIAGVVLMFQAIRNLQEAFAAIARYPLELEKLRMGIVHATGAAGRWVDVMGKPLPAVDQIKLALGEAEEAQARLTQQSIKYGVSIDGLIEGYKIAGGMLKAAGFTLEEAVDTTSQLTVISNAFGISQTQLSKTIDNIIKGYRVQQTQLGVILGLTTEEIRQATKRGELAKFLNERLEVTAEALRTINLDTFSGRLEAVTATLKDMSLVVVGPLFDMVSESLSRFLGLLQTLKRDYGGILELLAAAGWMGAGAAAGSILGPPGAATGAGLGLMTYYSRRNRQQQQVPVDEQARVAMDEITGALASARRDGPQALAGGAFSGPGLITKMAYYRTLAGDLMAGGMPEEAGALSYLAQQLEKTALPFEGRGGPSDKAKKTKAPGAGRLVIGGYTTEDIKDQLSALDQSSKALESRNRVLNAQMGLERATSNNRERLIELTKQLADADFATIEVTRKRLKWEIEEQARKQDAIRVRIEEGVEVGHYIELNEQLNDSIRKQQELDAQLAATESQVVARHYELRESIANLTDAYIDFRDINRQVINDLLQGMAFGTGKTGDISKRYFQNVIGKVFQEQIDELFPKGKPTTGIPKNLLKRGIEKFGGVFGITGQSTTVDEFGTKTVTPGNAGSVMAIFASVVGAVSGALAARDTGRAMRNQGGYTQSQIIREMGRSYMESIGLPGWLNNIAGTEAPWMKPVFKALGIGQPKTTGTYVAKSLEEAFPEVGIPVVGGSWKQRRTDILAQLGYPERGMAMPGDIGELGAYGRQAGLFYAQGATTGRGKYDPNYIRNALLNTAAALRVTGEEAEKMIGKFTQAVAGKDMDEAILNFQKLHVEGKITNADFEQGIKGILEAYTDLPNVIDQARLAQELFTEDGRISMEALKRAIEDTASITEGISGALKSLAKDGNFIDAAQALGEAFGDTLLERLIERILEGEQISKALTEVSAILTEAAAARGLGDTKRANQLINEATALYLKEQTGLMDVAADTADVYRLFASNIGLQYGGGGSVRQMRIPSQQHGGIVPGPIGVPRLVVAHGGEKFSGGTDSMDKMNYHMGQMVALLGQIARSTSERPIVQAVIDPVMLAKSQDKVITNRSYGLTTPNPRIGA